MNKCPLCHQKKSKRHCPSLSQSICPTCCGNKRDRSIRCLPGCHYRDFASEKEILRRVIKVQALDPLLSDRIFHDLKFVTESFLSALGNLRITFRSLEDRQVLEALEAVQKSVEVENRGILYEPSSTDPSVQSVIRSLRKTIRTVREQVKDEYRREYYGLGDILDCLHYLILFLQTVLEEQSHSASFLDCIAQWIAPAMTQQEPAYSLIITP